MSLNAINYFFEEHTKHYQCDPLRVYFLMSSKGRFMCLLDYADINRESIVFHFCAISLCFIVNIK